MAIGTFPGMLQEGTHASRPAATAVGSGALYACSDHGLIYQSDGATWSTWATLGGGAVAAEDVSITDAGAYFTGTDVEAALQELGAGGGGGGGGWDNPISEDGSSVANLTTRSGTWGVTGGVIRQSMTGATHRRATWNLKIPIAALLVYQAEIRIPTGSAGADAAAGLLIGQPASDAQNALAVGLEVNADTVQSERSGTAVIGTPFAHTLALDTYYTLRVVFNGGLISIYVDGTLKGTHFGDSWQADALHLGLVTYDAVADFRNIEAWHLTLPV